MSQSWDKKSFDMDGPFELCYRLSYSFGETEKGFKNKRTDWAGLSVKIAEVRAAPAIAGQRGLASSGFV
jgi:hypothetical protein